MTTMIEAEFSSLAIARGRYDPSSRQMILTFMKGDQRDYVFFGVPEEVWAGLLTAKSAGQYYAFHIKDQYTKSPHHEG